MILQASSTQSDFDHLHEAGHLMDDEKQKVVQNHSTLTLFRGFRLFRIFRLARKWKSFHLMMVKIVQSLQDLVTFFILFMIIVFVFALLGNEMFAYRVRIDDFNQVVPYPSSGNTNKFEMDVYLSKGESPRPNFDNFVHAIVGIFVIIIGEDW